MAEVIVKVGLASTIDEAHSVLMRGIGESGMKLSGGEKQRTSVCNADCIFCYEGEKIEKERRNVELDDYKKLFEDAKAMGAFYIGFSGREPLCNPDVIAIIKAAKSLGYRVGIIRNGQLLHDELITQLIKLQLARISISFHGYRPETYSKHFNVDQHYYEQVLQSTQKLINGGANVGIAYTVTKYNINVMQQI